LSLWLTFFLEPFHLLSSISVTTYRFRRAFYFPLSESFLGPVFFFSKVICPLPPLGSSRPVPFFFFPPIPGTPFLLSFPPQSSTRCPIVFSSPSFSAEPPPPLILFDTFPPLLFFQRLPSFTGNQRPPPPHSPSLECEPPPFFELSRDFPWFLLGHFFFFFWGVLGFFDFLFWIFQCSPSEAFFLGLPLTGLSKNTPFSDVPTFLLALFFLSPFSTQKPGILFLLFFLRH